MTPPRRAVPTRRAGFTLIEMIVVIVVVLILAGLTLAVVGRTVDGDRVRGGARQVQNYLSGARDRAIYAASRLEDPDALPPAIGVRFLPDPAMTIRNTTTGALERVVYSSMVFVQEVEPLPTRLTVYQDTATGVWHVSQFAVNGAGDLESFGKSGGEFGLRAAGSLLVRGLLPSRGSPPTYYLPVYFDRDSSREPYYVQFQQDDLARDNPGGGAPIPAPAAPAALPNGFTWWLVDGILSKPYFDATSDAYTPQVCRFRVLPSVMPSEEPRLLPQGCVIDGNSSSLGGSHADFLGQLRSDGSFDVMFNSRGIVEGPMAASGQIHLFIADSEDVERGFRVGDVPSVPPASPAGVGGLFVNADGTPYTDLDGTPPPADADGDNNPDERLGEEFIVSVRTQTGSIYTSEVNPTRTASGLFRADPYLYADGGGEAR